MSLPIQPVTLFFGATDQDTGKKGVRLGNLVKAENVRQVKGGEFSKRDGFTQTAQTYEGQASLTPDSIVSPNGSQILTRDALTHHVFARTATGTNQDRGHADRFVPHVRTRFPALGSGAQQAPMAKQCGKYIVYLEDETHFRIVEVNQDQMDANGSDTRDSDAIVRRSAPISFVPAPRSFAVADYPLFDADNLWIFWVDHSNKVWARKVPHSNLDTGTLHTVYAAPETSRYKYFFTSVTAGYIEGGLALAACGVGIDTTVHYFSPGHGGDAATAFRQAGTDYPSNYGRSFSAHGLVDHTTGAFVASQQPETVFGVQVAAGCTLATSYGFQTSGDYWSYAYFGVRSSSGNPGLIVIRVKTSDASYTEYGVDASSAAPDDYGKPADWSDARWTLFGWFYNAQIAAKETPTGVDVRLTVIPYYVTNAATFALSKFKAWNPDYLTVQSRTLTFGDGSWVLNWEKLGCAVAQGVIRQRDNAVASPLTEAANYLMTAWEDKESLQTCYHVREWDTGEIVAQLAYGLGAHVGGTGTRDLQAERYVSDLHNPTLCSWKVYSTLPLNILVGLQSENQNGSVDVAHVILEQWDYATGAPPQWQVPFAVLGVALSPGPIATTFNGFQQLREAGPLVYPSRPETFVGETSS